MPSARGIAGQRRAPAISGPERTGRDADAQCGRSGNPRQALRDQAQAAREACRDEAKAQGLKGADHQQHIQDCFAAKMPQVAKQIECRKEGVAKGITQPGLRDYVRQCMASKG